MEQQNQNKEFIIRYFNAISGVIKTQKLLEDYITDEELLGHIAYFDSAFPKYEMFADEMTSEGNRVVVRARWNGYHEGELNGILPTHRKVEMPFVISYEIENGKIAQHWLIQHQLAFMEQLGLMNVPA
jgi:predicted ester cyclase